MNTNEVVLHIANHEIHVFRKDIKNMHLSVNPPLGSLKLVAPLKTDDDVIRLFAISKLGWIKKQVKSFKDQLRESPREYVSGKSHYFQGRRYLLEVKEQSASNAIQIVGTKKLVLKVKNGVSREEKAKLLKEWYRKQLKKELPSLIEKWQEIIGVQANDWGVKQMKTKWGSCNIEEKRIWLNLELAKKPPICLEYILVHELVHLHERNHNNRFVALLDKFMPKWRIHRDLLNSLPVVHNDWGY